MLSWINSTANFRAHVNI